MNTWTPFEIRKKIDKVKGIEYDMAIKLIYEWVKTGAINLKEFRELLRVINQFID